jgi:hypothetical protein
MEVEKLYLTRLYVFTMQRLYQAASYLYIRAFYGISVSMLRLNQWGTRALTTQSIEPVPKRGQALITWIH